MRFTDIHIDIHIALIFTPPEPGSGRERQSICHHKNATGVAPSRMQYRAVARAALLQHCNCFA